MHNTAATPLLTHAQPWWLFFFGGAERMRPGPLPQYDKPALTFAQQLARLRARGMHVTDTLAAEATLACISYYRLSAYWYPFRQCVDGVIQDRLEDATPFSTVIDLYEFDRKLRLLVMDAMERVEVHIRTAVTYTLGELYGAFGHEHACNFHSKFKHAQWLEKLHADTLRSNDAFITHFRARYAGFPSLPIWMCTELLSLGALSRLYRGMLNDDKKLVAARFNLHWRRLQDWLHVLTYVRNVCAHHSRLWNRQLAIKPQIMRERDWSSPLLPAQDRLFCVLLMLRYLLRQSDNGSDWHFDCNNLIHALAESPRWRKAMGLPEDWQNHPIWR